MMSMDMVFWPDLTAFPESKWVQRAKHELLTFPNGKHDDLVDALAHLGRGVHQMISLQPKAVAPVFTPTPGFNITPRLLKEQGKRDQRALARADR
jgi:hypothetical protein